MTEKTMKPTDPYSDDTGAAFYRLPAGFRRARKYKEKEELGRRLNKIWHFMTF